ncbi:S41 family peptidase [Niabella sp.]|uniref:S41 family peptidase n=1 Tax=Niabella sp. TaxID=1962976 RepID=UPI0026136FEE|nr:S41 family peptidase [Niabella sp.]
MNTLIAKQGILRFAIFMLFYSCFVNAQAQRLTPQQYIEDLEYLKNELPKKHKNLFAKISEKEFNIRVKNIEDKSNDLTDESFEIELYKLIKEIGDEHTSIVPVYKTIYPLNFGFFKEGIFITNTDSLHAHLLYKKLGGINGTKTEGIIKNFKKIAQDDNQSYFKNRFQYFIKCPGILKGLSITSSDSMASVILDNKKYLITSMPIDNFSPKNTSKLLRFSNYDNYWYQLINDGNVLYFNYQACSEQEGKPFDIFNKELFNFIESKKPQKIVIDLRNNGGGNSAILEPFLNKLKDNYLNKKGSLYVLIGKNTFSSAVMNAVELKRNYNSILVGGEPTGGNVNHYGEVRGFQLPNSKITVGYSTQYWENWKGYKGPLLPDIKIEYSIYNFRNNIDEAIEYAKKAK